MVAAEQPPDIAIPVSTQNEKVQCAEHDKPVVEEPERASVDSEDALPAKAFVWPTFANMERADNAVDGESVGAAEQLSAIALKTSARNKGVECSGDGQLVIEELELTYATSEDSTSAKVKSAAAQPLAVLSLQNNPAGFAERPLVPRRLRETTKRLLFDPTRLAGAELGAGDGKRRRGGVSDEMSAPARAKTSSRGAHSALEDMGTHLSTFSFSVAQVREIRSRADAAKKGRRSHESQRLQRKAGRTRQRKTGRTLQTKAGPRGQKSHCG